MNRVIRCTACGISLAESKGPCPRCGAAIGVSVQLAGTQADSKVGSVGAASREPTTGGGERIQYSAPTGARSDSVRADGRVGAVVEPPVDVGRKGEEDVFARVLDVLAATGTAPVIKPRPKDDAGEDRVVKYGNEEITIQIACGGPGTSFWRDVSSGRGEIKADLETAAEWARDVISRKAILYSPSQKHAMLLALDLRHLGVLADPELVNVYLRRYGPPDGFGFGGVWLIGPTEDRSVRLGNSKW
jgi:hypothetical protein